MGHGASTCDAPRSSTRNARVRSNRASPPCTSASTKSPGAAPRTNTTRPSWRASPSPPWTRDSMRSCAFNSSRSGGQILRKLRDDAPQAGAGGLVRVEELQSHARLVHAWAGRLRPDDARLELALRLARELQQDLHHVADRSGDVGVHETAALRDAGAPSGEAAVALGGERDHQLVVKARPLALGGRSIRHGLLDGTTAACGAGGGTVSSARSSSERPSCPATVSTSFSEVPMATRASSSSYSGPSPASASRPSSTSVRRYWVKSGASFRLALRRSNRSSSLCSTSGEKPSRQDSARGIPGRQLGSHPGWLSRAHLESISARAAWSAATAARFTASSRQGGSSASRALAAPSVACALRRRDSASERLSGVVMSGKSATTRHGVNRGPESPFRPTWCVARARRAAGLRWPSAPLPG